MSGLAGQSASTCRVRARARRAWPTRIAIGGGALILVDQDRGTNRAQLGTTNEGNQRSLLTIIFAAQMAFSSKTCRAQNSRTRFFYERADERRS
jgi:hypothetical protein